MAHITKMPSTKKPKGISKTKTNKKLNPIRIFTIGHSNRTLSEFIEILEFQKIKLVVDVRKIPKSRHNPHFWGTRLARSLDKKQIDYIYLPALAGRRRPRSDSKNTVWQNLSFRGYADHMDTDEFKKGLRRLMTLSKRKKLVIMCAEAVPWRCHRSLIADALMACGLPVHDIFSKTNARPHKLPKFAKIIKHKVRYA